MTMRFEGVLELVAFGFGVGQGALLEDRDRRDVGQGLGESEVFGAEGPGGGVEQGEGADEPAAQPQRQDVGGHESCFPGTAGELWPVDGGLRVGEVDVGARLAAAVALDAGALVVLEGEQLQQPGVFVGGCEDVQDVVLVREQDADGRHVQEFHAAHGQPLQQVDDVEVGHQGVGDFDEDLGDVLFTGVRASVLVF